MLYTNDDAVDGRLTIKGVDADELAKYQREIVGRDTDAVPPDTPEEFCPPIYDGDPIIAVEADGLDEFIIIGPGPETSKRCFDGSVSMDGDELASYLAKGTTMFLNLAPPKPPTELPAKIGKGGRILQPARVATREDWIAAQPDMDARNADWEERRV